MQYVIQPGDTLFSIASRFNTTVQAILTANPQITNPNVIRVGMVIIIPGTTPGPPSPPPPPAPSPGTYVVQRGDTLSSIARRFGTTVNAILAANPQITNPNLIYPGQVLVIPGGTPGPGPQPPPPPPPPASTYVVQRGDTLSSIARRFGTTVQSLLALNPQITNPNIIYPGQVIRVR